MFAVISDLGIKTEYAKEHEARAAVPKGAKGWKLLSPSGRALKIHRGRQQKIKLPSECDVCGGLQGMMGVIEGDLDQMCDCE